MNEKQTCRKRLTLFIIIVGCWWTTPTVWAASDAPPASPAASAPADTGTTPAEKDAPRPDRPPQELPPWRHKWEPTGETITKVEWIYFETHLKGNNLNQPVNTILRLTTNKGTQGYALCSLLMKKSDALDAALIGMDPGDPEAAFEFLENHNIPGYPPPDQPPRFYYRTTADIAMWDLMGKIRGKPVHELLGTKQERIKIKFSIMVGGKCDESDRKKAVDQLQLGLKHGFRAVHVHIHNPKNPATDADVDNDILLFRELRQVAGPDVDLIADTHWAYTVEQAVRVGKVLQELKYRHLESPLPERNSWMDRYVELQKQLTIPVCAPEILQDDMKWGDGFAMRKRWVEAGAVKLPRSGHAGCGGFTPCLWTARMAAQKGSWTEIHHDGDFSFFYDLQIMAAFDAEHSGLFGWYGFPPKEPQIVPWMKTPTVYMVDGYVPVPKTPGMGVEINWEYVDKNRHEEKPPASP